MAALRERAYRRECLRRPTGEPSRHAYRGDPTLLLRANLATPLPRWASQMLVAATAWLVLLGTLVPIVSPGLGAWLPVHEHQTLTAFVPPHTHTYERQSSAPAGAACEATPHAHTSAQDVHVVCTTSGDLSSGALAVVVPEAPVTLPGVPIASISGIADAALVQGDPHASVVTPPPRP